MDIHDYNHLDIPEGHDSIDPAITLVRKCISSEGFIASPGKSANYSRVWGRDGVIIGLAALMTDDENMIRAFRNTLLTLAAHQGPHGAIPSNVDFEKG